MNRNKPKARVNKDSGDFLYSSVSGGRGINTLNFMETFGETKSKYGNMSAVQIKKRIKDRKNRGKRKGKRKNKQK